ncbi:hypothetical protein KIL84_005808 [Mauremys mutica]|uniref:Uncharacterized protein n=1 Tax=Mauremys mutica TaxID=74926 RepID=A0A9D4B340_9SAUR|nr:hypothetical protein KIL84_005808 [Mauremys mutica]
MPKEPPAIPPQTPMCFFPARDLRTSPERGQRQRGLHTALHTHTHRHTHSASPTPSLSPSHYPHQRECSCPRTRLLHPPPKHSEEELHKHSLCPPPTHTATHTQPLPRPATRYPTGPTNVLPCPRETCLWVCRTDSSLGSGEESHPPFPPPKCSPHTHRSTPCTPIHPTCPTNVPLIHLGSPARGPGCPSGSLV